MRKVVPILFLEDKEVHRDYEIILGRSGQHAEVVVLAILGQNGWTFSNLKVWHKAPNTTSNTTVRAVLAGNGFLKLDGVLKIDPGAHGAQAQLKERALLLSDQAKIETIPSLEVLCNDVKASHGASVSRLSDEELFYLQSRGIKREEATKLLTEGFVGEILRSLPKTEQLKAKQKLATILGYA